MSKKKKAKKSNSKQVKNNKKLKTVSEEYRYENIKIAAYDKNNNILKKIEEYREDVNTVILFELIILYVLASWALILFMKISFPPVDPGKITKICFVVVPCMMLVDLIFLKTTLHKRELYSFDNYIILIYFNKRRYRVKTVNISNLSYKTKKKLKDRVERPLQHFYECGLVSKRAEVVYKSNSVYLTTLAEDLKKAICECENEFMENALINRLHVVEEFVTGMRYEMYKALDIDNTEKSILKELKAEGYRPFSLTEELNKLM